MVTTARITAEYVSFNPIRQVAPRLMLCMISWVHIPYRISIGHAIFAGFTVVTNRQTTSCATRAGMAVARI